MVGKDNAICLDRGTVGWGHHIGVRRAKAEVLGVGLVDGER